LAIALCFAVGDPLRCSFWRLAVSRKVCGGRKRTSEKNLILTEVMGDREMLAKIPHSMCENMPEYEPFRSQPLLLGTF
jgi:hypothetical protein